MSNPDELATEGVDRMDLNHHSTTTITAAMDHGSNPIIGGGDREDRGGGDQSMIVNDDDDDHDDANDSKNTKPAADRGVVTSSHDGGNAREEGDDRDDEMSTEPDDDDDDDDDEEGNNDINIDMPNTKANKPSSADECLMKAVQLKDEGNGHFSAQDWVRAARSYRRGCQLLKKYNVNNTGDEQIKSVLIALQSNLSMVYYKQNDFRRSADIASHALRIDPTNVKALYRRAVANRQRGHVESARDDLKQALQSDPSNAACRKELLALRKQLDQTKQAQKNALAKAFQSSSSLLYDDKEKEQKIKEELAAQKKQQEQELYKKRKQDWEDECVKRMANNEPAISFEEYETDLKQKEEKDRKDVEKKQKEEERKRKEERRKARAARQAKSKPGGRGDHSDSDDEEFTEQELAKMRGYKKTADGRMTSYFTRELSDEQKKAIGDIAPKRLDSQSADSTSPTNAGLTPAMNNSLMSSSNLSTSIYTATTAATASITSDTANNTSSRPSVWNQAGTWEEKDTTPWCTAQLRKRLDETCVTMLSHGNLDCSITEVEELTGHASVAITGTKKRYIFDFHAKLKYEIKDLDSDAVVASGAVRLPDLCSGSHEELEVLFESWKERPSKDREAMALDARARLTDQLRINVHRWVQEFNDQY